MGQRTPRNENKQVKCQHYWRWVNSLFWFGVNVFGWEMQKGLKEFIHTYFFIFPKLPHCPGADHSYPQLGSQNQGGIHSKSEGKGRLRGRGEAGWRCDASVSVVLWKGPLWYPTTCPCNSVQACSTRSDSTQFDLPKQDFSRKCFHRKTWIWVLVLSHFT